jgi:hypothetical protein
MTPKNWKKLERHPLSAEYRDITGRAWDRFVSNLRENGLVGRRPVVIHDGKVLDGWQLLRGCVEAGIKPEFAHLPEGTDPQTFVETANDHRRHETQEAAVKRIEDRRERVAASRRQGKSIRIIADEEGVGVGTVQRDLDASTVPPGTVEPEGGKVKGKDQKTRPAKNQAKKRKSTVPPGTVEPPGDADESVIEDVEGVPVPEQARVAFLGAPAMTEVGRDIDAIGQRVKAISETPAGRLVQYEDVRLHLKNAKGGVIQNKPTHVCPLCQGKRKDCQCCKGTGWTVEHVYKRLTAEAKR